MSDTRTMSHRERSWDAFLEGLRDGQTGHYPQAAPDAELAFVAGYDAALALGADLALALEDVLLPHNQPLIAQAWARARAEEALRKFRETAPL